MIHTEHVMLLKASENVWGWEALLVRSSELLVVITGRVCKLPEGPWWPSLYVTVTARSQLLIIYGKEDAMAQCCSAFAPVLHINLLVLEFFSNTRSRNFVLQQLRQREFLLHGNSKWCSHARVWWWAESRRHISFESRSGFYTMDHESFLNSIRT